ncbi:MAG: ATP-binding cassette domain-containing protein [Propionibacteriaceae bacterium]|nr:ATP-binding cassette domain-containing protein [Propionibacteriaceae bacterium]
MLEVTHLTRTFGAIRAADDISFQVPRGAITGFIGGNGAGKTTTMRMILGVLHPDSGQVSLDGRPVTRELSRHFGYMPEERGLYPKMRVAEQIAYLAALHGFSQAAAANRAETLLKSLGLGQRLADPVEKLSLGNQQRAQIAAALAGDPDVLVLDEPFSGLDPMAVDTVGEILRDYVGRGVPLIFSSHQLDLVERLCDHLVIIAGGRIRTTGSRAELLHAHAGQRWEIECGPAAWIADVPGVSAVEPFNGRHRFAVTAPEGEAAAVAQEVLRQALGRGPVAAFAPWQPNLVEVFREVIVDEPQDKQENR